MTLEIAAHEPVDAATCFALGMNYSAGVGVAVDLVEAHKWFNIAAMRGHADAAPCGSILGNHRRKEQSNGEMNDQNVEWAESSQ